MTRMLMPAVLSSAILLNAATASEMEPLPVESRNFIDISFTAQLMPAIPVPLLTAAPIVPATWVPWP